MLPPGGDFTLWGMGIMEGRMWVKDEERCCLVLFVLSLPVGV